MRILKKLRNYIYLFLQKCNLINQTDSDYFNRGFRFTHDDYFVNERVVEKPIVISEALKFHKKSNILDFGCTKSSLAIELASLGYQVTGVDLREYKFTHPNFNFKQINLLNFQPTTKFDFVIALSVIEHIGLGAYGEKSNSKDLQKVLAKFKDLIKPKGKLFISIPVGKKSSDNFLRSFTTTEASQLMQQHDFKLSNELFFIRRNEKVWLPATKKEVQLVSNTKLDRGVTGVNAVGCYIWLKN